MLSMLNLCKYPVKIYKNKLERRFLLFLNRGRKSIFFFIMAYAKPSFSLNSLRITC